MEDGTKDLETSKPLSTRLLECSVSKTTMRYDNAVPRPLHEASVAFNADKRFEILATNVVLDIQFYISCSEPCPALGDLIPNLILYEYGL